MANIIIIDVPEEANLARKHPAKLSFAGLCVISQPAAHTRHCGMIRGLLVECSSRCLELEKNLSAEEQGGKPAHDFVERGASELLEQNSGLQLADKAGFYFSSKYLPSSRSGSKLGASRAVSAHIVRMPATVAAHIQICGLLDERHLHLSFW